MLRQQAQQEAPPVECRLQGLVPSAVIHAGHVTEPMKQQLFSRTAPTPRNNICPERNSDLEVRTGIFWSLETFSLFSSPCKFIHHHEEHLLKRKTAQVLSSLGLGFPQGGQPSPSGSWAEGPPQCPWDRRASPLQRARGVAVGPPCPPQQAAGPASHDHSAKGARGQTKANRTHADR